MAKKKRKRVSAKKAAEKNSGGIDFTSISLPDGVGLFDMKEGIRRVDILPYTVGTPGPSGPNPEAGEGDVYFERTFYTHRDIGADGNTYVCLAKTAGKKCPVCESRASMLKNGADKDVADELLPKKRQLWNVYDREAPDKNVQVWDVSFHLFGKQLYKEINNADEDDDFEFFADPQEGSTLRLGIEEVNRGGYKFNSVETIGFKVRKTPLSDEVLEQANDLDGVLTVLSYKDLEAIYLQTVDDDGEDEEEDNEDDEEEVQPKKRTRVKTKRVLDESALPAEDDGEEDEDEEPKKRRVETANGQGKAAKAKAAPAPPKTDGDETEAGEDDEDWDDDDDWE